MKSIIQDKEECFITHDTYNLHSHHICEGRNRKNSEKYGLKVWLRGDWHNQSNYGVHFNKELDTQLKKLAQEKFIETYPDLDFLDIFKINYL